MTYRLAIFDFDGTLVDSLPWFVQRARRCRRGVRHPPVGEAERQALRACHPREVLRKLNVPLWKVPRIAGRLRQLKAQQAERLQLFPGRGRAPARPRPPRHRPRHRELRRGGQRAPDPGARDRGAGRALCLRRRAVRQAAAPARCAPTRGASRSQEAIYVGDELRDADGRPRRRHRLRRRHLGLTPRPRRCGRCRPTAVHEHRGDRAGHRRPERTGRSSGALPQTFSSRCSRSQELITC